MKTTTSVIKLSIACLLLMTIVASCHKENKTPGCTDPAALNYNPNARQDNGTCKYNDTGTATFYSFNYGPVTTVTINGQSALIPQYFNTAVSSCNTTGCANFSLAPGSYPYTASSAISLWSGNITVDANGCSIIQLSNPNTTFYSPTFNNVTVTIAGQNGTITQLYSTSPGCSAAGCANFLLTSGNYSFTARTADGLTTWGPTGISIDAATCNTVVLQ